MNKFRERYKIKIFIRPLYKNSYWIKCASCTNKWRNNLQNYMIFFIKNHREFKDINVCLENVYVSVSVPITNYQLLYALTRMINTLKKQT